MTLPKLTEYQRGKILTALGIKNAKGLKAHRIVHPKRPKPLNPNGHSRRPRPVICIETGEVFASITAAARHHHKSPSNLCEHLNGLNATFVGYTWKYK